MTSLGSYGTATVLECDTLITNNVKNSNNGLLTSVYGQLKLPADAATSNVNPSPITSWVADASSAVVGITIDNTTGHITLAETGLYLLNSTTQFRTTGHGSQSQARLTVNRFGGSSEIHMISRYLVNSQINKEISLTMNYMLKINDIRDSFEIDAFNTGPSPTIIDDGTFINVVKIL